MKNKYIYITFICDTVEYYNQVYIETIKVFSNRKKAKEYIEKYIKEKKLGYYDEINIIQQEINSIENYTTIYCCGADEFIEKEKKNDKN